MQSIEYALRELDKGLADERERAARTEKALADFKVQAGKPYEHEGRLKELIGRQAQLNALLDLDKGERQVAPDDDAAGKIEDAVLEERTRAPPLPAGRAVPRTAAARTPMKAASMFRG